MIPRRIEPVFKRLARQFPVVTVTGPRQSGKTTLCRAVFAEKPYVNLEPLDVRDFANRDPRGFLARYPDGAILDEIQRAPDLPSYLQELVDEDPRPGRFILTGSQQFEVVASVNQSLAGRTALLRLLPFGLDELGPRRRPKTVDDILLTGFYPRIHDQKLDPVQALADYLVTYVERDLRQLINLRDLRLFETFLKLCAGRIGQLLNLHSLANDVGVSHVTIRAWISLLEASYIVFLLVPHYANVNRRLIKAPKLYFYDVGLASRLLGLEAAEQVSRDPLRGHLFENLVVAESLKFRYHRGKPGNLAFYRDSNGNEVDLVLQYGRDLVPIEIKAGATVSHDFFKGIRHFERVFPAAAGQGIVFYGGARAMTRENARVAPGLHVHEVLGSLAFERVKRNQPQKPKQLLKNSDAFN